MCLSQTPAIAAWWDQINEWRKVHGLKFETPTDGTMKPQQVVEALYKATNGDAIITSDVGQHQMFGALYYKYKRPRQWINSGGLGTMGVGLPYAMAAKLAFLINKLFVLLAKLQFKCVFKSFQHVSNTA